MIIVSIDCIKLVGYIYNATYSSNDTVANMTYKNTCAECICQGFFYNMSQLYIALNCYKNIKKCEFFTNYSNSSTIKINLNSTFIFIQQPPIRQNKQLSKFTCFEFFVMM